MNQQAEIDELAELAKIGGGAMSEAENPELLGAGQRDHRRGHPRPRRRLHPPLRPAGPQPHPPPDRAAAGRPPGPARRRAQDRRARGAGRAQRRPARDAGDRALVKTLAPGVWRLKQFPAPADQRLPGGGRADRRRAARWDRRRIFAEIEGRRDLDAGADPRPPRPPGRRQGRLRGARHPARLPRRRRRRDGGPAPGPGGGAEQPVQPAHQALWQGPPHKVDRVLHEGDEVAGFRVVHAPGHARGEVIFFRDSDRVAICGDVIRNMSYATALPGLAEPPDDLHLRPGREPPLDPQARRAEPGADPPRPRPRGDRHGRLRAFRRRPARVAAQL